MSNVDEDSCFVSVSIDVSKDTTDYTNRSKRLIDSVLKHTNKTLILVTNRPDLYDVAHERFVLKPLNEFTSEPVLSGRRFNMHLKRIGIVAGKEAGYKNIVYCDCDVYFNSWDENVYQNLIQQNFDIAYKGGTLLKSILHHKQYQLKLREFGHLWNEDFENSVMMCEALIVFKNTDKLTTFLDFWNELALLSIGKNYFTYYDTVYFGTAARHSKMKTFNFKDYFPKFHPFTKQFLIQHGANGAKIINF